MNTYLKIVLVALAALVVVVAAASVNRPSGPHRYAIAGSGRGHAYILNTVTGTVKCCNPQECWEVKDGLGPSRSQHSAMDKPTALDMILGQ